MKYVLVHWIESNETSILSEEFVKDKSMLNDPEKEGMVIFGDTKMKAPKAGWKSYLARVLEASNSKKDLMKSELEFINGEQLEDSDGSNSITDENYPKRLRLERLSAGNKKPEKNNKKSTNAKKKADRVAYNKVFNRITATVDSSESDEEDYNKDECGSLPDPPCAPACSCNVAEEIRKIQNEVSRLHMRLPGLVKEAVVAALADTKKACTPKSPAVSRLQTPPSKLQPFPQSARSHSSSLTSSSSSDEPPEGSNSPKLTCIQPSVQQLFWGSTLDELNNLLLDNVKVICHYLAMLFHCSNSAEYIDSVQISEVMRSPNFRKMTVNLMTALFERKVLSESSVTGKSKEGRPALDRIKVELIIAIVLKKFPEASDAAIKATMALKCKDLRMSMEYRRKKQEDEGK